MAERATRRYGPQEYVRHEGAPLAPSRLAAIWRSLPEEERFSFVLSLDETLADQVIAATVKYAPATTGRKEPNP